MIHAEHPEIPVIVITGSTRIETILDCLKTGAYDYLIKPVDEARLVTCIRRALHVGELNREVNMLNRSFLSDGPEHPEDFTEIITVDRKMRQIFRYIETIAKSPKPVLVTGESGTGKELVAEAVHALSGRAGEFIPVNISGLDDAMFSDTLFGHVKGAYTGASDSRKGLIEQAKHGTLFLDEIGDLGQASQVKLLRLIQENEYFMLGSDSVRQSDARIIFATNADLLEKKRTGEFRKDLYFRIMTHRIALPPLRDRKEDIPLLVDHFIEKACATLGRPKLRPPEKMLSLLMNYRFPGNIRELEGLIFDAVSMSTETGFHVDSVCDHISKHLDRPVDQDGAARNGGDGVNRVVSITTAYGTLPTVKDAEDYLIERAFAESAGNMTAAARKIGLSPATMMRRLRERKTVKGAD